MPLLPSSSMALFLGKKPSFLSRQLTGRQRIVQNAAADSPFSLTRTTTTSESNERDKIGEENRKT